jgi:biopolymer transport protein ExbD/biopolymer transport protein TolR
MPSKVRDLLVNRLDRTVYVRADARARYQVVVDVVDNLRAAGVDQLGLLTELSPDAKKAMAAPGAAPK